MSVPVSSIIAGPSLRVLPKHQCEISFSVETDDGGTSEEALVFEAVEAFRCTHLASLGSIDRDLRHHSYGTLISLPESAWLEVVRRSYVEYCASAQLIPKELHHLMITFDDGPCYEFICGEFNATLEPR